MTDISILVKQSDGTEVYVGQAAEVTLTAEPLDLRPQLSTPYLRTLTLAGDDVSRLAYRKLRRAEIRRIDDVFETGLAFDAVPAVVHEDGRFVAFTEKGLRAYVDVAQYQEMFPRDEIKFIDV